MSPKIEELLEFDRSLLLDVGVFDQSGEGKCSYLLNGEPRPVTIGGKRLVLPLPAICRAGEWTALIAFHPLAEQINQGPSPVLNALKDYILERVKATIREIAVELMKLATDATRQKPLSVKARKYLNALPEVDEKTVKALTNVLDACSNVPEKRMISLLLKNGGKSGALRSTLVAFPFMDDAESEDTSTFFGVNMPRKTKDKARIVALLDYILGGPAEREVLYNKEVRDGDAPYLHALLLTFQTFAERLNNLIDIHGPACPTLQPLAFNLEWTEKLKKFEEFSRVCGVAVPMLPGNSGVEVEMDKPTSAFERDAEEVGLVEKADLPFDTDPNDSGRRDSDSRRDRDDREDDRDRNRSGSGSGKSLGELLGKRRDDRDDRGRDRGRDDRGGRSSIFGSSDRGRTSGGRRDW